MAHCGQYAQGGDHTHSANLHGQGRLRPGQPNGEPLDGDCIMEGAM